MSTQKVKENSHSSHGIPLPLLSLRLFTLRLPLSHSLRSPPHTPLFCSTSGQSCVIFLTFSLSSPPTYYYTLPPHPPPCHVNDQLMAIGKAIWAIVSRSVEPFQKISRVHTHTHTHTTRVLCNTPCLPLTVWSNKSFSVSIQSAVYASKPLFYSHGRWVRPQQ